MVKRILKYAALFVAGLTFLGIVVVGSLIRTESGSRWLLAKGQQLSPLDVQYSSSEGRIADRLILHDLALSWEDGSLHIEEVDLEWSPLALLFRKLDVASLNLKTPVLQLHEKTEAANTTLSWPELPVGLASWQVEIEKTSLIQARYVSPQGETFVFDGEASGIGLDDGVVTVNEIRASHLDYTAKSALRLDLFKPQVAGDLSFFTDTSGSELSLSFDLKKGSPEQLLAGPISGRVHTGEQRDQHFSGHLLLGRENLVLTDLEIKQPASASLISGSLELSWVETTVVNSGLEKEQPLSSTEQDPLKDSGPAVILHGNYDLTATGPELVSGSMSGDFAVKADRARIGIRDGTWLGSELTGDIQAFWQQGPATQADIRIRGLDPARIAPEWTGLINMDASVTASQLDNEPRIDFDARLLKSRLRGLPLNGVAGGAWQDGILSLTQADLAGDGFRLTASGSLAERLGVEFEINDLSLIRAESKGQLDGRGWVGRSDGEWIGSLSTSGKKLQYGKLTADSFSAVLVRQHPSQPANINLSMRAMKYGTIALQSVEADLQGDPENHEVITTVSFPEGSAQTTVIGQATDEGWQGTIKTATITHQKFGYWELVAPASGGVDKQGYSLDTFDLAGPDGRISLSGRLKRNGIPQQLSLLAEGLPLSLLSPFIDPLSMTGELDMALQCDNLSCAIEVAGVRSIFFKDYSVAIDAMRLDGTWGQQGLNAALGVKLPGDGHLSGTLSSKALLQSYDPIPLQWAFAWKDLPLFTFDRLPEQFNLSGTWRGHFIGSLLSGTDFQGELHASLKDTLLSWKSEDSKPVDFVFEETAVDGTWQGERLAGSLQAVVTKRGRISSSWQLPVPARWPIEPETKAGVSGQLSGHFAEQQFIGALWPDLVQDTRGEIKIDTRLDGTWGSPKFSGKASLRNGQAYLPVAGITFKNVKMKTLLKDDRVVIENLAAESAPGKLSVSGYAELEGWLPSVIDLNIKGEDFTLIDLPELRVRTNPDLTMTGTNGEYEISGKIVIPYFLAVGRSERSPVQVSADAVIVGQQRTNSEKDLPFNLKTNIKLVLGDQVLVNMFGLNARLGGQLTLTDIDRQHFTGSGLIEVREGNYSSYGVKLKIEKGEAHFAHGPLDNPAINILALKNIGETKAGVQIDGTAKAPRVKLYSEPAMPDTDILSLIVLGRPLDQAGGEQDPLMLAAGALLSAGDSVVLRNQLQNKLGIDSITAESEGGESEDTILRVGKYLTPDLYLSYGYALFGQRSEAGLRYRIHKGWEAESKFGLESGADIYYRFEFD